MTSPSLPLPQSRPQSRRNRLVRRLRAITGAIMLVFVTGHLIAHASGLFGIGVAQKVLDVTMAPWTVPPGSLLLPAAFLLHASLGLRALYLRRSLRMPPTEALQLALGLLLPMLLAAHITGVDAALSVDAGVDSYTRIMALLWTPTGALRQFVLLGVVWLHGMIGLGFWLKGRGAGAGWIAAWRIGAWALPLAALLGFLDAGRSVAGLVKLGLLSPTLSALPADLHARAQANEFAMIANWTFAIIATFAARGLRHLISLRHGRVVVTYPGGRTVRMLPGGSVLEASRLGNVPHVAVCGGRGRCSTCRVEIVRGLENLPPADAEESALLSRIRAPAGVRLACRLHPTGPVTVHPLLKAQGRGRRPSEDPMVHGGREKRVAILFTDIRGSTAIAEQRPPYDIMFLLERYFETIGGAVEAAGGTPNAFVGDEVMAIFGADGGDGPEDFAAAATQALHAAGEIARRLEVLNRSLVRDLGQPLRIGIGIHGGPAVVGRLGYGETRMLTAVGDTVHVARRLEELTKAHACLLVVSDDILQAAGRAPATLDASCHEITVRGRVEPLAVHAVPAEAVHRLGG